MKITLVRPPFYALFGVATPKMKTYPLNLLYLATYVRDFGGHDVKVVDGENILLPQTVAMQYSDGDPEIVMNRGIPGMIDILNDPEHALWQELAKKIMATEPQLVGITCNSGNMDTTRVMVRHLKKLGVPTVLGGSHPTAAPAQSIHYTGADMVVVGEGEKTLLGLADSIQNRMPLESVEGLVIRKDGQITMNPKRAPINDLDDIPVPDRSFLNDADYFGNVLITGRGCPFNCAYCASRTLWGRKVRLRSVTSIVHELRLLRDHAALKDSRPGRWVMKIVDDTFTVNRSRTAGLLDQIIAEGLNCFEFTAGVRADTLDEHLVSRMKQANFKRVTLGVESGSPRILKMIRKGETNEDVIRALKLLRDAGIHSHTFLMIGLPGETFEDIELSKKLIIESQPNYVEVNMVTPYPGTEIFEKLMPEGVDKIDRWYRWFHQGMATHSKQLGYDLDKAYSNFLAFAREYNNSQTT
ncbi:MAG: anaerobic magnesium-protoporphyrin monomethyl ester cyclase [Thermodesulfobacteriota bacterium]|nr:anaerobic magnesium-protoporphyrin monomethyl ester cyclase [Thermodesulfobacteriota bacterium]